jgi:hypothetical protein
MSKALFTKSVNRRNSFAYTCIKTYFVGGIHEIILKKKIPKEFYKLFRTKNRDAYMQFLVAIYEENNEVYTALGLTIEECRVIIADTIAKARIIWEDEEIEEEDEPDTLFPEDSPSGILNTLIRWGWLKSDFDEKLNTYIISFPEYSQLFTELFQKLQTEDDSRERESILSIYSALFTYHSDTEKNNDILKNALQTDIPSEWTVLISLL